MEKQGHLKALCIKLAEGGNVPEWVELIPAGGIVSGRNGGKWINNRPDELVAVLNSRGELVVDYEHASEIAAPKGQPAPAAGWADRFELRDGSIWAHIAWNKAACSMIAAREYRYVSPVILYNRFSKKIGGIDSIALTNQPNLELKALNSKYAAIEERVMDPEEMAQALGLPADASEADILAAAKNSRETATTKALNRADTPPDLAKFVPRSDYDSVVAKALNSKKMYDDLTSSIAGEKIDAAVDAAVKAGKITPASVDYHKANCRREGGLADFDKYIAGSPSYIPPSGLDGKSPPKSGKSLDAEDKALCSKMGITEEDYLKAM